MSIKSIGKRREEGGPGENGAIDVTEPEKAHESSLEEVDEYPKGLRLAVVILSLILSFFLVALDLTIIATAIPRITGEFQSIDHIGWYGSAFFLTLASFQSTWGKTFKFFLLKKAFVCAIGIFQLGSLICDVARNSITLVAGRAIPV